MTRTTDIDDFLSSTGLTITDRKTVAGDASNRKYDRLSYPDGGTAILMDAPPEKGEDVRPFLSVGEFLTNAGLSAPTTFFADEDHGILIIEDFGDQIFDRVIADDPNAELDMYLQAWAALWQISQATPPTDIPPYGPDDMAEKAMLVPEWYDPTINADHLHKVVLAALNALDWSSPVLVLRDFHAQNLVWLADRSGAQQVGLLDYQDAQPGHCLYDLISLVYDARRDVTPETQAKLLDKARSETDLPDFDQAIATLLMQRSLRILGVFARLWLRDGKLGYLDLMPRVYGHLQIALTHPALQDVARVLEHLSEPTDTFISNLKAKS